MMSRRIVFRVVGTVVAIAVLVVAFGLAKLTLPGTPSSTRFVHFDGFVKLPRGNVLNVLDYITYWNHSMMVTNISTGTVFKVGLDQATGSAPSIERLLGPPKAHGVAIATSTGKAFVTRSTANTVDMFDPATMNKLSSIEVPDDADGIIYDPAADLIYVANGDAQVGTLIDPHGPRIVARVPLGGKPEFPVYDPKTGLIYQNLNDTNEIVAIDPTQRKVVDRRSIAPCDGPTGLALDNQNRRLIAVCGRNAVLIVIDMASWKVVTKLSIGSEPDSVAYDAEYHRIYTAGAGGRLDVIEQKTPNDYVSLDSVKTHFGAHTLAIDPSTHKIYVAYASLFVSPRLAVFSPTP